jgi:hypothetical protein
MEKNFYRKICGYSAYTVDGDYLRENDKNFGDFCDFAIHDTFPKVPDGEIWIGKKLTDDEKLVSLYTAGRIQQAIDAGVEPKTAWDNGAKYSQSMRDKMGLLGSKHSKDSKADPRIKLLTTIGGVKVHLVSGEIVRDEFRPYFIEGGHGYVYSFIPKDEIWIDNMIPEKEYLAVWTHEYVEMQLMRDGKLKYDKAHMIATDVEYETRAALKDKKLPSKQD